MKERKLLDLVSVFGYRLAMAGAETYRVEESITLILKTYGYDCEVFCIPNCLSISIDNEDGDPVYRMRRIGAHGNDLDGVERYSNLSRRICHEKPDLETFQKWLDEVEGSRLHYDYTMKLISGYLCGFGFSILFGGRFFEGFIAGFLGVVIMYVDEWMNRLHANHVFSTIFSAFCSAMVSYVISVIITDKILPFSPDAAIIGALMILVPGMLFTNSMRDIMYGDTNSGIIRSALVLLESTAIALGTAVALFITMHIWGQPIVLPKVSHSLAVQLIVAFIGCMSFALQFNAHGGGWVLCPLGGALAWLAYALAKDVSGNVISSMFVAAIVSSIYAEVVARIRKYPAISYLVIAGIPLFPGSGVYYTMFYAVQGDMEGFAAKGYETAGTAAAIALAVLLVSTGFRMWSTFSFRKNYPHLLRK